MLLSERQSEILHRARSQGRVEVEALAAEFEVTTQTIRRDLNDLSLNGLLARVHGGAVPAARVANVAYAARRGVAAPEKRAIGQRAAEMIPDGCSLIVNVGTTTEEVARALVSRRDLVVITNNLNVVAILSGTPQKELILAGGVVRQTDGAIVGRLRDHLFIRHRGRRIDLLVDQTTPEDLLLALREIVGAVDVPLCALEHPQACACM